MLTPKFLVPLSLLATAAFAADGDDTGATATDSTAASSGCLLYTIQANDTGYNIAKSFGLEFSIVNASNPNVLWEKIAIGESVLIPKGYTTQPDKGVTPAPSCPAAVGALPNAPRADPVTPVASGSAPEAPPAAFTVGAGSAAPAGSAPATGSAPPSAPAPAASAKAAPATSGCKAYIVVSGDTGYEIAQKNGITMAQMNAQNPNIVWEKLEADQILVLPPTANSTDLLPRPDCKPAGIIPPPAAAASAGSSSVTVASPPSAPPAGASPAAASAASSPPAAVPSTGSAGSIKAAVPPASPIAAAPPAGSAAPAAPPAASGSSSSGTKTGTTVGGGGAEPVSVIKHISPASDSCESAKFKDECATAADAAKPIVASFAQYKVTTAGEQAALLSWMLFESGGFKFNRNHFPEPGRPGQGTRTMMMPNFVEEYAQSIPALKTAVAGVTDPDTLLKLVMVPEYTFGSAAWFYSTKCDEATKTGLKAGTTAGWEAWLKNCVQTEVGEAGPEGRKALYDKAREALGVKVE